MYPNDINIGEFFKSKNVLIIGACGTIGKNLAKQLLKYNPARLRLLDANETALTELDDELNDQNQEVLRFLIGDIRNRDRLIRAFEGIDYVFHCAALKHVAIGEFNPREVIQTNIIGTENVIEAAFHNNVRKVLFTSSDKAVNPVNTMGASKLLGEKLIVAANNVRGFKRCTFSAVRFGNVLGSRGSILPRFKKRIEKRLDLTVTDPNMTRYILTLEDAINLTLKSMVISVGGEIFVLKMQTLILNDLVELFREYALEKHGIRPKVQIVGTFPGEKRFEELMTENEVPRAIEFEDMYVVLPHIKDLLNWYDKATLNQMGNIKTKVYKSDFTTALSKADLKKMLEEHNIFEKA